MIWVQLRRLGPLWLGVLVDDLGRVTVAKVGLTQNQARSRVCRAVAS